MAEEVSLLALGALQSTLAVVAVWKTVLTQPPLPTVAPVEEDPVDEQRTDATHFILNILFTISHFKQYIALHLICT